MYGKRNMVIVHVTLAVLLLHSMVQARELHPEGQAARLFSVEEADNIELPLILNDDMDYQVSNDGGQNNQDIEWFKTDIVNKYGFQKDPAKDIWLQQGNFAKVLGEASFVAAANRALEFFKRNDDWETTKNSKEFRKTGRCLELLYITAARYLLVTHILWEKSSNKLTACERDGTLTKIPPSVCYPEPYGTASCTSDYDVGLIGKDAGALVAKFNEYFEGPLSVLKKTSENVFDTNVYAFTLEYAMPAMFSGLPKDFQQSVETLEVTPTYQMQELVGAYFKVFKYNEGFFQLLFDTATKSLRNVYIKDLAKWKTKYEALNKQIPLKDLPNLRAQHNKMYQQQVKAISELGGYGNPTANLDNLATALLYAAEAYHTRGAIRYVVGNTQMRLPQYASEKLSLMDFWVSMIENWGESNKEFNHSCDKKTPVILEECLLKISKYMWRMLAAMRILRERVPPPQRKGLITFAGDKDPETTMQVWVTVYKQRGVNQVPSNKDVVRELLLRFDCNAEANYGLGKPLSRECMQSINNKVNVFNVRIAKLFSGTL